MSSAPSEQDHFERARDFQAHYQDALAEVGVRIPPPRLGQTVNDYRRETLHALQRNLLQNHEFNRVNYRNLASDALQGMEKQTLQACKTERVNPRNVPPGQLKPIKISNPNNSEWGSDMKAITYIGAYDPKYNTQHSFIKDLTRAGRRVLSFATGDGRIYDAAKGSWR